MSHQQDTFRWKRSDVTSCDCTEKSYRHVHCPCSKCSGRATDRSTEMRHWEMAKLMDRDTSDHDNSRHCELSIESKESENMEVDSQDHLIEGSIFQDQTAACSGVSTSDDNVYVDINVDLSSDPSCRNHTKTLIVNAILNALKIQNDSGLSINTFTDILDYAKKLLLESNALDKEMFDPDVLATLWPKSWNDVQRLLKEEGFSDAKEYIICFCNYESKSRNSASKTKYTGKYSIMESKSDLCKHCGKPGFISYYYLGLEDKVKHWFRDKEHCQKMLSHWMEREHWLQRDESWPIKKEIWDGERWRELQWFWDPNESWILPCCCPYCGLPISVDHLTKSEDGQKEREKVVECPACLESFVHNLKTTTGSPFNIALIGHWDGWQAFSGSSSRSCGTMEVTIANLSKKDRNHTDEVYVLGFVPLAYVPKLPVTYDPFLEPLMKDVCKGFIDGFEIDTGSLFDIDLHDNVHCVRVLLICWSGDHPGQCEIGKILNQGKCPCRRCKLIGQHLPQNESNKHMYYGENRLHYRNQWEPREISEMLTDLYDVEAETRQSVRKQMSSNKGVTGISLLHKYLYPLYGFDILQDLTVDVFHTVCLNVVKKQAERLLDLNLVNKDRLNHEIKNFPWPKEFKRGRLPRQIQNYNGSLGQWKGEGLQKFSFPLADCILDTSLEDTKEREIQHLVSRITEFHFNTGRYGWTDVMIDEHRKLVWRLNILVEEIQGLEMCTISMHNLLHVHEDIIRFSGTDNYWCTVFERAVKGYVKRSSNCKGIEKTFAFAELRREFLKPLYAEKKDEIHGKIDCKLGIASSLDSAKVAIDRNITSSTSVLLGSLSNISLLDEVDRRQLANTLSVPLQQIQEAAYLTKKCSMADRSFGGTVFASGETAVITINHQEVTVKLDIFLSLRVKGDEMYQLLAKGHIHHPYRNADQVQQAAHFWTGFTTVKNTPVAEAIFCKVSAIQRKVILYKSNELCCTVVDYERQKEQLPFDVVVPVYPEKGDMLYIQGEGRNDIWYGHACKVNYQKKLVDVFFFVEHPRKRNIYVRETYGNRARNVVPWKSLIGVVSGKWKSSSFVQWQKMMYKYNHQ